jgi:spermidine synthase
VALGGGAMTVPRWVDATRPGSGQTVLEIDPDLVDLVDDEFGLPEATIVTGDGRVALRGLDDDSVDVVVGDAFGSRSVPWHLATREFMADIAQVLRPGGVYVANVIDGGDESFLRAEAATLAEEFTHVGVMRGQSVVDGFVGNSVIVASDAELDLAAWDERRAAQGDDGALVVDADYVDDALVLTDDFAPVDQLITGTR